jgi:hypothetical protein
MGTDAPELLARVEAEYLADATDREQDAITLDDCRWQCVAGKIQILIGHRELGADSASSAMGILDKYQKRQRAKMVHLERMFVKMNSECTNMAPSVVFSDTEGAILVHLRETIMRVPIWYSHSLWKAARVPYWYPCVYLCYITLVQDTTTESCKTAVELALLLA